MNFVISVEGVLSDATGDLQQKGLVIYRALKSLGRVTLLTEMSKVRAEGWLMINNVFDYDDLIDNSVLLDPDESLRERQLKVVMSKGPVSLYVEADPDFAAEGLRRGITTLLFCETLYSHFKFRPDVPKTVRPWDQVVAERVRQQAMIAADKRTSAAEMGTWE